MSVHNNPYISEQLQIMSCSKLPIENGFLCKIKSFSAESDRNGNYIMTFVCSNPSEYPIYQEEEQETQS